MTITFDLHHRPGALERLLNRCRRKGWTFASLSLDRHPDDPTLDVVRITFDAGVGQLDNMVASLARCLDVAAITPEVLASAAQVA